MHTDHRTIDAETVSRVAAATCADVQDVRRVLIGLSVVDEADAEIIEGLVAAGVDRAWLLRDVRPGAGTGRAAARDGSVFVHDLRTQTSNLRKTDTAPQDGDMSESSEKPIRQHVPHSMRQEIAARAQCDVRTVDAWIEGTVGNVEGKRGPGKSLRERIVAAAAELGIKADDRTEVIDGEIMRAPSDPGMKVRALVAFRGTKASKTMSAGSAAGSAPEPVQLAGRDDMTNRHEGGE